jgi:Fe2+ transport system protein FeoA
MWVRQTPVKRVRPEEALMSDLLSLLGLVELLKTPCAGPSPSALKSVVPHDDVRRRRNLSCPSTTSAFTRRTAAVGRAGHASIARSTCSLQDLHARASALQAAIDEEFEERMDAMLEHPRIDPHGRPIPGKNASWPKLGDSALVDLPPGTSGQVSRITTDSTEVIKYLHGLGVRPGAVMVLENIAPFDGPVSLRVKGNVIHLGRRVAQAIHVTEEDKKQPSSVKLVRGTKEDDAG